MDDGYVKSLREIDKQSVKTLQMIREYLIDATIRRARHPEEDEALRELIDRLLEVMVGLGQVRGHINQGIKNHAQE